MNAINATNRATGTATHQGAIIKTSQSGTVNDTAIHKRMAAIIISAPNVLLGSVIFMCVILD